MFLYARRFVWQLCVYNFISLFIKIEITKLNEEQQKFYVHGCKRAND